MLPRVSNALTKFIAPIGTSVSNNSNSQQQKGQEFQRFQSRKQLHVVERAPDGPNTVEKLKPQIIATPPPTPSPGKEIQDYTDAFFKLISLFQQGKNAAFRKRGAKLYEITLHSQKKIGKSLKGAILDAFI